MFFKKLFGRVLAFFSKKKNKTGLWIWASSNYVLTLKIRVRLCNIICRTVLGQKILSREMWLAWDWQVILLLNMELWIGSGMSCWSRVSLRSSLRNHSTSWPAQRHGICWVNYSYGFTKHLWNRPLADSSARFGDKDVLLFMIISLPLHAD
jgi:hypothetical protein